MLFYNKISSEYDAETSLIFRFRKGFSFYQVARANLKRLFEENETYKLGFGIHLNKF